MKRNLKHKIKQDEFRSGMEHSWDWTRGHWAELRIVLLAVVVVGALVVGLNVFQKQRQEAGEHAFGEAQGIFDAPLTAELPPGEKPAGPSYATPAEKYQKARASFDAVAAKYGSSRVGLRARYYSALCRVELGDTAGAEKELQELANRSEKDALVPGLARLALAETYRRTGQVDKAVAEYGRIVDDPNAGVPRDHALMRLASTLEEAQRGRDAGAAYRRLVEEFPTSVYAADARRRADYLEPSRQG